MKIGLCGTMSVGKTTLVNALKELEQFLAERCAELTSENIITDRTILDVMAFTWSATTISYQDKALFDDYAKAFISEYDYIFYISPDGIPVEDNGIRTTDIPYRGLIDSTIKALTQKYGDKVSNLETISGTTDERIQQILNITGL
jgi:GTPase SAR1 family protein